MKNSNAYRTPWQYRIMRPILKPIARAVFRAFGPVTISGVEHIPYGKPYVAAMNHVSIFDPPFAAAFWPEWLEIIGAAEVFDKPGQGLLLKAYGVIPVHRGEYDRVLLNKIVRILKAGMPLLIAPEGGRSHVTAMQRALPGISYIVEQTSAPVVPVGLVGTTPDYFQKARRGQKPTLEMRIGKPIMFPEGIVKGTDRHAARQKNADFVMSHIAGLLPEEYRGVYAGTAIRPA